MRSSSGSHFLALDQIRAFAAFLVFAWHFNHFNGGQNQEPLAFPLSLLTEGHTGVAIFMTLSGYLFAKLLDGKAVKWPFFWWNRLLRLAPLLVLVFVIEGFLIHFRGGLITDYLNLLLRGFIEPVWPNGGWSIAVELQFYLLLPILLIVAKNRIWPYLLLLIAMPIIRFGLYQQMGEVHSLSYWTLVGRADQFLAGILIYNARHLILKQAWMIAGSTLFFIVFWWWFDSRGGFFQMPSYPSTSRLWILIPTIEGICYALAILWYDEFTKNRAQGPVGRFIAEIGTYSYSIYLLHFFLVFWMGNSIHAHIIGMDNPYLVLLLAVPCFLCFYPIGWLSYRLVEKPFLKLRKPYLRT